MSVITFSLCVLLHRKRHSSEVCVKYSLASLEENGPTALSRPNARTALKKTESIKNTDGNKSPELDHTMYITFGIEVSVTGFGDGF